MELAIPEARQWILCWKDDDVVPPEMSREYARFKKSIKKEKVELVEIARAGHFELIDPGAEAFTRVRDAVMAAVVS